MKDFIIKIDNNLKISFNDDADKAAFRLLLSSLKRNGHNKFLFRMEQIGAKTINDKQKQLIGMMHSMISKESGNDREAVKQTLTNLYYRKYNKFYDDFTNEDLNQYIDFVFEFSNEFFDVNLTYNDNGHIEVKKIR